MLNELIDITMSFTLGKYIVGQTVSTSTLTKRSN